MREVKIGDVLVTMRTLKRGEAREMGLEKLGVGPLAMITSADALNPMIDLLLKAFEVPEAASDQWEPEDFKTFYDNFRAEQYRVGPVAEEEAKNSRRSGDGPTTRTE